MSKKNDLDFSNKRMLTKEEVQSYTGLGRVLLRPWCESIGAVRKIGTRVLYDKFVIDKALDQMAETANNEE